MLEWMLGLFDNQRKMRTVLQLQNDADEVTQCYFGLVDKS